LGLNNGRLLASQIGDLCGRASFIPPRRILLISPPIPLPLELGWSSRPFDLKDAVRMLIRTQKTQNF